MPEAPQTTNLVRPKKSLIVVIVISLVAGGIGGGAVVAFLEKRLTLGRSQQVVLEESSAIINVAKKLEPSVVSIKTEGTQLDIFGRPTSSEGAGSGLIIKEDGLVLTNKHVVGTSGDKITVTMSDDKDFEGTVVARDPFNDLAFVKIDAKGLTPASLGDSDQVVVGQKVVAIGNALGEFQNTVTSGIISGIGRPVQAGDASTSRSEQLQDLFQTDASINPGNSGGPLVNIDGQVIGLNTAIAELAENIGFAIPINQAKSAIASIEKSGKLQKPYVGVRYVNLTKEIANANGLSVTQGAYIISDDNGPAIVPDSPAAKSGLKEKDIIIKVDNVDVNKQHGLATLIGKHQVGDKIRITFLRGSETKELEVSLEAVPQD